MIVYLELKFFLVIDVLLNLDVNLCWICFVSLNISGVIEGHFFLFWKKQLLKANKNLWENGLRNDLKKWHYIYKNKRGVRWKIEGEVY